MTIYANKKLEILPSQMRILAEIENLAKPTE